MKASHPFFIKDIKAEVILNQIFTVPCMWCRGLNIRVDFGQIHWLSMLYHTLEEMFNTKGMTATEFQAFTLWGRRKEKCAGKTARGRGRE